MTVWRLLLLFQLRLLWLLVRLFERMIASCLNRADVIKAELASLDEAEEM